MLEARDVLQFLRREMSAGKISLLQLVAAILAVRSQSSSQRLTQIHCQQVVQSQDAIAKLLAKSQSTIAAYVIL